MLKIPLNSGTHLRYAVLRELTGHEELDFAVNHPVMRAAALSRLMLSPTDITEATLPLVQRDRLLAGIYIDCFGDAVESIVPCQSCRKTYEFGFSLTEYVAEFECPADAPACDDKGIYQLRPGVRFRLPNVEDERLAANLDDEAAANLLLSRCLVEGRIEAAATAATAATAVETASRAVATELTNDVKADLEAALARLAPLLRSSLDSTCPHCETAQTVEFDLVSFFHQSFERERALLTREIHCLASAYRFGYDEILGMPRRMRQSMVELLLAQRDRGAA
ncbi:MAG: hypothetical protein QM784_22545 [Polyangiaceae bacterium]